MDKPFKITKLKLKILSNHLFAMSGEGIYHLKGESVDIAAFRKMIDGKLPLTKLDLFEYMSWQTYQCQHIPNETN